MNGCKILALKAPNIKTFVILLIITMFIVSCNNSRGGNNDTYTPPVYRTSLQIISPNGNSLNIGSNFQLSAIADYSDGSSKDVTEVAMWESENDEIATISNEAGSKGLVTGINKGSTIMLVKLDSSHDAFDAGFEVNIDYAINESTVSNVSELRAALLSAENNGMHDVIVLGDGIYVTTSDGLSSFVYTGSDETSLTLIGSDPANVILSGDGVDRVLYLTDNNYVSTIFLKNISIRDGNGTAYGGGFVSYMGELNIDNCIITNNHLFSGGGIGYGGGFIANGKVVINGSLIQNNSATYGGGFAASNEVIINDSSIIDNIGGFSGGGIYSAGFLKIDNSLISRNKAELYGGGIFSYYDGVNDQIIKNSTISYNEVSMVDWYAEGGGIHSTNPKYHIFNTIVTSNSGYRGSGIYCTNLHFANSIVQQNNSVESSIGMSGGNESVIVNSLVMDNTHGVFISDGTKSLIINSAFLNNGAFDISAFDTVRANVGNCFIDENNIDMAVYAENNIFSNNADDIGFVNESAGNYRLKNTSIMIDAGVLNHTVAEIPLADMDGIERPQGVSVDIGPFEYIFN